MKRFSIGALLAVSLCAAPRRAEAFVFHDLVAFGQRVTQLTQFIVQTRQVINGVRDNLDAFKKAYEGLKDWKNLGWIDTLKLLDSPWLDNVKGIDEMRFAAMSTAMSAEQASGLWKDIDGLRQWRRSGRYGTDPWFRRKVDSLTRQSARARAQRAAFVRQMQKENQQLIDDVKKIERIHGEIERENKKTPVNHAKVASLEAELAAMNARSAGQNIMLTNQRAIMFLVGEDEAQRVYLETIDSDWLDSNSRALQAWGKGFAK
jgi:hypothetical protein